MKFLAGLFLIWVSITAIAATPYRELTIPLADFLQSPALMNFRRIRQIANQVSHVYNDEQLTQVRLFRLEDHREPSIGPALLHLLVRESNYEGLDFQFSKIAKDERGLAVTRHYAYWLFPKKLSSDDQVIGADSGHRQLYVYLDPALRAAYESDKTEIYRFRYLDNNFNNCIGIFIVDNQNFEFVQIRNCAASSAQSPLR